MPFLLKGSKTQAHALTKLKYTGTTANGFAKALLKKELTRFFHVQKTFGQNQLIVHRKIIRKESLKLYMTV